MNCVEIHNYEGLLNTMEITYGQWSFTQVLNNENVPFQCIARI